MVRFFLLGKKGSDPFDDILLSAIVLRQQLVRQELFERLRRKMALEHSADGDGDGARLL